MASEVQKRIANNEKLQYLHNADVRPIIDKRLFYPIKQAVKSLLDGKRLTPSCVAREIITKRLFRDCQLGEEERHEKSMYANIIFDTLKEMYPNLFDVQRLDA